MLQKTQDLDDYKVVLSKNAIEKRNKAKEAVPICPLPQGFCGFF
jgi:hypothetical protein